MIHIQDVIKIYTTEAVRTTALAHLTLRIEKGEFVAVMGPSGCGKSTLLNVLGLLDCVCKGKYEFDGEDVTRMGERERTHRRNGKIGFVFQSFNLIDELTVAENVELPLLYSRETRAERCRRAHELLERMGIAHRAAHYPQQLSGGQKQRAAIARAMVTRPKLILADEPTGNLDYKTGRDVMALLRELNEEGTTVVMVTHSEADAAYATRRVYLQDGRVVTPPDPAPQASGEPPQAQAPVLKPRQQVPLPALV
jgi:putative ABC transport system ATP-binding protein